MARSQHAAQLSPERVDDQPLAAGEPEAPVTPAPPPVQEPREPHAPPHNPPAEPPHNPPAEPPHAPPHAPPHNPPAAAAEPPHAPPHNPPAREPHNPPTENPDAPASPEPGAPEAPSRPHGDELGEEAIPADADASAAAAGSGEPALEELMARAQKADEYLALAQRTKADFENYRKRAGRDAAAAQERGIAKLARELLPAVDNLDRAVRAAEAELAGQGETVNGSATLLSGIRLVHQDVLAALARVGIEPYSPQGEQFDPQHHEAVAQQPIEGAAPGTIVEVYQTGYRLGEAVLRPARVLVAG